MSNDDVLSDLDLNASTTAYSTLVASPIRKRRGAFGSTGVDEDTQQETTLLPALEDDGWKVPSTASPASLKLDDDNDNESELEFDLDRSPFKLSLDDLSPSKQDADDETTSEKENLQDDVEETQPTSETEEASSPPSKHTSSPSPVNQQEAVVEEEEKAQPLPASEPPDLESVLSSTDVLFQQVDDKMSVTVKDIMQSLQAEYNCKLPKAFKASVRQRLAELINNSMNDEEEEQEDDADAQEESENEREASDFEGDAEESEEDDDDEDFGGKKTPRSRRSKMAKKERPKRLSQTKKKSAMRIHAEKLRKKRMEELRVRNEELQIYQNKQDQERAEQIAAKFETNTEELRLQRLENRLGLLQRLDQKRITVIQVDTVSVRKEESKPVVEEQKEEQLQDSEEESSSDEEMELELVGKRKLPTLKVDDKPNALSLLDLADRRKAAIKQVAKPKSMSPGQSLRARAALKSKLLSKQRKMGNMWLARELGYKSEQEHLQDCMIAEEQKRQLIIKLEQERLKRNEHLRERFMEEDADDEASEKEFEDEEAPADEEDDEEMAMAKTLEQEAKESEEEKATSESLPDSEETDKDSNDSTTPNETELAEDDGDVPMYDGGDDDDDDDDDFVESERLETQAPFVNEVSLDTDGLGEGTKSSVSDDANKLSAAAPSNADAADEPKADTESAESATGDETTPSEDANPDEEHAEEDDESPKEEKPKGPRNSAWLAMLQKEKEAAKKAKKRKNGLVEEEADEEEEEEVAGLEDFGFTVHKKKNGDDDDDVNDDDIDEDDLKHVVDDVSDGEGDEDAGEKARKALERKEEKERHKEILRRMREGYDGRRGGIAVGGAGARGLHRFDQLVAADNREDAKRLGLLNDDELDSDDEDGEKPKGDDEEEDENALLDKMLKDRFLHRSSVELEENFSDDEEEEDEEKQEGNDENVQEEIEEREQERLAKRFAKRARMQRLIETYGHDEEFSQSKLIDEDATLKQELQKMKNGLARKRSVSSQSSSSYSNLSTTNPSKKHKSTVVAFGGNFLQGGSTLSLALQNSRSKTRTSFVRGSGSNNEGTVSFQKSVAFNHVVFHSDSRGGFSNSASSRGASKSSSKNVPTKAFSKVGKAAKGPSSTLWSKAVLAGFQKSR